MGRLPPHLPLRLLPALAAGLLSPAAAPAFAQAANEEPTITVTAPSHVVVGRSSSGAPIRLISLSAGVGYGDIDLRTAAGRDELNRRVTDAAREACRELNMKYPGGTPGVRTCARNARDDAQRQIDAAIDAAVK